MQAIPALVPAKLRVFLRALPVSLMISPLQRGGSGGWMRRRTRDATGRRSPRRASPSDRSPSWRSRPDVSARAGALSRRWSSCLPRLRSQPPVRPSVPRSPAPSPIRTTRWFPAWSSPSRTPRRTSRRRPGRTTRALHLHRAHARRYALAVEQKGFKRFVQSGIVLQIAQTTRLDIPLEVGAGDRGSLGHRRRRRSSAAPRASSARSSR